MKIELYKYQYDDYWYSSVLGTQKLIIERHALVACPLTKIYLYKIDDRLIGVEINNFISIDKTWFRTLNHEIIIDLIHKYVLRQLAIEELNIINSSPIATNEAWRELLKGG